MRMLENVLMAVESCQVRTYTKVIKYNDWRDDYMCSTPQMILIAVDNVMTQSPLQAMLITILQPILASHISK